VYRCFTEQRQCLRLNLQEFTITEFDYANAYFANVAVLGLIFTNRK
jgi:hypothetical protein